MDQLSQLLTAGRDAPHEWERLLAQAPIVSLADLARAGRLRPDSPKDTGAGLLLTTEAAIPVPAGARPNDKSSARGHRVYRLRPGTDAMAWVLATIANAQLANRAAYRVPVGKLPTPCWSLTCGISPRRTRRRARRSRISTWPAKPRPVPPPHSRTSSPVNRR